MKTDKNKWFVACCPIRFRDNDSRIKTPDNKKYLHPGDMFQCLIDDVRDLSFKFNCHPTQNVMRYATEDEVKDAKK